MNGLYRNMANKITFLLEKFPIVVILGVRQAGKTTLSRTLCPHWKYTDLEKPSDFDIISGQTEFFFKQHPQDLIIDEAQIFPQLFNVLRGVIDEQREKKGRYIITGSSSPELMKHASESLAGRAAIVELGTLKANEFYQKPLSPFYQLFEKKLDKNNVVTDEAPLTTEQIQNFWLHGGYPEPILQTSNDYYQLWMQNYQNLYVNRDIAQLFPKLNKRAYQRFLSMLSKLSGTIVNRSDLARAIEISEGSIREYLTIADGTFIWRSLPSYEKNIIKSVIKMPKGHLRDTGLLHFLLKINSLDDLYHHPTVGYSFEGFVIEEIIKGLEATTLTNWTAHYYRTRKGAKIDLILDGYFGMLPIEIKYGSMVKLSQLQTLKGFVEEHHLPFGMVINQSDEVRWLTEKIVQVPVGWL